MPTIPGSTYTLSYYLANDGSNSADYFSVAISNTIIQGSTIDIAYPTIDNGFDWKMFSFKFAATSTSTPLTFIIRQDSAYFYLTNISVTATC